MSLLSRLAVSAARAYGVLSSNPNAVSASYLVVAGGGGGSGGGGGGGGGAGGLLTSTFTLSTLNTYTITIGAGGTGGASGAGGASGVQGSTSSVSGTGITTVSTTGGGYGANGRSATVGGNGGSGGGGGSAGTSVGGTATSGQGSNGGTGYNGTTATFGGGGGGGAGAVGQDGYLNNGGGGGIGLSSSISGSATYYAGGGGAGAGSAGNGTTGGNGGGGSNPVTATGGSGTANTGGGGAGGSFYGTAYGGGAGGSGVVIISYTSATPKFVGGTLTTSGGNQIHTFTSSGTLSPLTPVTASYLVVAGGGGGGGNIGGGGGAGGLLTSSTTLYSGATYTVTVGAGGAGGASTLIGSNGTNSVLSGTGLTTLTSTGGGGGGGGSTTNGNGASGGSGGGGGYYPPGSQNGAAGTSGQGFAGGNGQWTSGGYADGGGGGGASAVGANGTTLGSGTGGAGGAGSSSSISGSSVTYAGGGGGAGLGAGGAGGSGGGGAGSNTAVGIAGTTNTGGGGGGGGTPTTGGAGGSGTVIISYAGSQVFNGGLVTSSGGNTIHTFNATGALTPLTNNLNNSLRFRSSASAYLSRTPASNGNRQIFTFSFWAKRGTLSAAQEMYFVNSGGGNFSQISWAAGNGFTVASVDASVAICELITTPVYRDPSAWYHIVVSVDTTQATSANRIKIYVNGNQVTALSTATYPTLNYNFQLNNTTAQNIGRPSTGTFDGYMAEFNFIDGQALEPYYFGNNDAYGNWKPILYKGTYGTNGFYLTFADTSALTTSSNAGLGKDTSGNGNYWTTNNISITAGTTYDAMTDVPTNTSATVANYAVYDQLTPSKVSGSGVRSISAANLYVTNSGPNGWSAIGTTITMTSGSGKWYWEVTCSGTTSNGTMIGIHRPFTSTSTFPSEIIGYTGDTDGYGYYMGGNKYNNSGAGVAYGASYTAGDVIGIALDMSTAGSASITFYKNNTSQGVAFSSLTGDFFAAVSQAQANGLDINFGQRPFSYTPPTGYVALNTYNLPTPTILQGNKYMDATLYTGNDVGQTVVNQGQFKPDFTWVKCRSTTYSNTLVNSVMGLGSALFSDTTGAVTSTTEYTSYNSNGFTLGATGSTASNVSAATYVAWQWQAGQSSGTSNTSGTITSTVSVSTTAGFSIVTYTGTGANATVGHGLGVAPSMIIIKQRSGGTARAWQVYHVSMGNGGGMYLNQTNAYTADSTAFNSTSPTSSVFSLGSSVYSNQSASPIVAYCWAEIAGFSKFGSYTGNGSTDGPFIYTGFRPKFIIYKLSSAAGEQWIVFDTVRTTYNIMGTYLHPSLSNAESTFDSNDFLSNGFKIRVNHPTLNTSGATYIYMAFAENPFKNSNAR